MKSLLSFRAVAGVLVAGGLLTGAAAAHHASGPFYDSTRKVEVQGTITKFVFMNPHAFLYIVVPDPSGTKTEWQIEMGAPISLRRTGWTPDTMKIGTEVKAVGSPSRAEGTHGMCCARITRPDGTPIAPGGRVQEEQQPPLQ